jgi:hypothetical protein
VPDGTSTKTGLFAIDFSCCAFEMVKGDKAATIATAVDKT